MSGPPDGPVNISTFGQFYGAVAPALGIGAAYLCAFLYLRPYLPDVYDNKRERARMANATKTEDLPPERPQTIWGWAQLMYSLTDDDILRYCGADSLMFLRFLRLGLKAGLGLASLGLLILLPINTQGGAGLSQFEWLSVSNIPQGSSKLYAHLLAMYMFTGFIMYLLHKEWDTYVGLRQSYLGSSRVQCYSIVIRDVPRDVPREVVHSYLRSVLGDDCVSLHLVEQPAEVLELLKKRDAMALKLARAREMSETKGARPQHKTGCMGLRGDVVDSIATYEEEVHSINLELQRMKEVTRTSPYVDAAVATFDSIRVATAYSRIPLQRFVRFMTVDPAPAPNDVLWGSLGEPMVSRWVRTLAVTAAAFFLIFFYSIPVGAVAALANLRNLARIKGLEFLQPVADLDPAFTSFLEGYIPPLLLSIFFSLVPWIMLVLSYQERPISDSGAQRMALQKVFWFVLIDTFLFYTLTGAGVSNLSSIIDYATNPLSIMALLAQSLPAQSTFFLNYIFIQAFTALPSEAFRLVPLILTKLKRHVLSSCSWDHLMVMTADAGFHELYSVPTVVFMAGLCYAPLAPVILCAVVVYFALAYCVWLNQLIYVYNIPYHTGGSQYPIVYRNCIISLVMSQVLFTGVMGLKALPAAVAIMCPLIALTIMAARHTHTLHTRVCESLTLEALVDTDKGEMEAECVKVLDKAYDLLDIDCTTEDLSHSFTRPLVEPYSVTNCGLLTELLPTVSPNPGKGMKAALEGAASMRNLKVSNDEVEGVGVGSVQKDGQV